MNRTEFVHAIANKLREYNLRKPIKSPRHVFHISDDNGNTRDFVIKASEKTYMYTEQDIKNILETAIDVSLDALKVGDEIAIGGYGTLGLKYRKARHTTQFKTRERIDIPGHHIPTLSFGKSMKAAAKLYDLSLTDEKRAELDRIGDDDGI